MTCLRSHQPGNCALLNSIEQIDGSEELWSDLGSSRRGVDAHKSTYSLTVGYVVTMNRYIATEAHH